MPPLESTPGTATETDSNQINFHPLKIVDKQPHSVTLEDNQRDGQLLTTVNGERWIVVPPVPDSLIPRQPAPFYLNGASEAFKTRQEHMQRAARGLPDIVARTDSHSRYHDLQETFVMTNWDHIISFLYEDGEATDISTDAYKEVGVDDYYVKVDRTEIQNNPSPPSGATPSEKDSIENCGRVDILGITPDGQVILIDFTTPYRSKSQQLARQQAAVGAIIKKENTTDPAIPAEVPPIHRFKGKYQTRKDGEGSDLYILEFEAPGKKYDYALATDDEIKAYEQKNKERKNHERRTQRN